LDPNTSTSVDGITPAPQDGDSKKTPSPKAKQGNAMSSARFAVVTIVGIPYLLYVVWSVFLLSVLPDATGTWESMIPFAKLISMVFGVGFFLAGLFSVLRIGKASGASDKVRYGSFARIALVLVPGIALSGFVPYWITQEPPLPFVISSPSTDVDFVAPLSISYSAAEAAEILKRQGLNTKTYKWDLSGDGKFDQETVTPESTAYYDRQGGYNVSVTLELSDGSTRTIRKRVVIPQAVFSYSPFIPVVDEPIVFSVAHLVPDDRNYEVREVQWDFNEDGIPDETSTSLEATHTFLRTGPQKVMVKMLNTNQTQHEYFRVLDIQQPLPNPFDVEIDTIPTFLESPPPFQVVFRLVTDEPLQEVTWDFDDRSPEETGDRVGHTFRNRKVHQVKAKARNLNGQIAKVVKLVKIVENLNISDLSYDGSHVVEGNTIVAEAPVSINLTPKTIMPLVDFWWEAPKASQVTSTDTTLRAIFRDEGVYNLVLLAKDAEGRVMRKPIKLEVKPKTKFVTFALKPAQGIAPLTVQFDASESFIPGETINGFIWDFGSAQGVQTFGDGHATHVFDTPGEYTVTLTVRAESGRSETASKTVVVRAPFLDACFTKSRSGGLKAPVGIRFFWECSTGQPKKVLWNFGDGSESESDPDASSSNRHQDHVFEKPGVYSVQLILENATGTKSTSNQTITVE
tara:strand:- start:15435 stop:17486 length:2052 start_codon:yes stop_codon:yes gene_type:complete